MTEEKKQPKDYLKITSPPNIEGSLFDRLQPVPNFEGCFYHCAPFLPADIAQTWFEKIPTVIEKDIKCRLSGRGPIFAAYGEEQGDTFPPFFEDLFRLCAECLPNRPFQCSANIYDCTECQLEPHKDSVGTQVLIMSLGTPLLLEFYPIAEFVLDQPTHSLLMEPNSIMMLRGPAFEKYLHGIRGRENDRLDESVLNLPLLKKEACFQIGQTIPRTKGRISLMMWNDSEAKKNL